MGDPASTAPAHGDSSRRQEARRKRRGEGRRKRLQAVEEAIGAISR